MFKRRLYLKALLASGAALGAGCTMGALSRNATSVNATRVEVLETLTRANDYWQANHQPTSWAFWDYAAYHTGNMEAYAVTGNETYRQYSTAWAEHNGWSGAKSQDKAAWKYQYGETDD